MSTLLTVIWVTFSLIILHQILCRVNHHRPAKPFGNKKKYFKGSFQFSIALILKISFLWKPQIPLFSYYPKLDIAYFDRKKILSISLKQNFAPNTLGCYGFRVGIP